MADYIDIDAPIDFAVYERNRRINATLRHLLEVNDAKYELADVRSVVFCRDCKYWELSKNEPSFHVCTYVCGATFVRNQDDFCSRGEKREES